MRAARYIGESTIDVVEIEPVPPAAGEVQIRVAYNGICGTDLHVLHGSMDARVRLPAVIGHEMSGTVAAVGDGVTTCGVGDPVTVMPLLWDGHCPACRAGHEHVCHHLNFIGIDSPGALQGLWTVPQAVVVPLPASLPLVDGALVEPVAVAVHDVRRGEVAPGDHVVVVGGGPIGLLVATVARRTGAQVMVVEPNPLRRDAIAELGFKVADPRDGSVEARVEDWTSGTGADVVFEVSGAPAAVLQCTGLARVRGTVVAVAIHPRPVPVDLQRVFWRELRIVGARVYERRDFDRAVELLAAGEIPVGALVTRVVPLAETAEAFAALELSGAMKILVDVQAEVRP